MAERSSLASLVDDFEHHGRDIAIVSARGLRQRKTSYAELAILARRFAAELAKREIPKGERILIWAENSAEWVAAFFGCVLRGVLPAAVDFASTPDFVHRVQQEVSPRLILVDRHRLATLGSTPTIRSLDDFDQWVTSAQAGPIDTLSEDDALQIVFTSGTTGEPKGVVHTHRNVLASLRPIEQEMQKYLKWERFFHPIRILHTLPLSHVFGQFMGLWVPPLLAAEVHYETRLVASDLCERIRRNRISVLAAVPRVLDLMRDYMESRFPDLPAQLAAAGKIRAWKRWWRFRKLHRVLGLKFWAFVCGGAALSPRGEQFWNALGFVVVQGYGMTETTAVVSLNHPFRTAAGTIGQVLPGREVRLDADGELLVRGDTISTATWQHGHLQQQESGWLATGDLAEFDEHGNLHFRGRKKDVIVTSSGLNIYPEDLEGALMRQPGVKASAVIEQQAEHGPEPLAILALSAGANAEAAVSEANRQLADFQHIRRWLVWPEADLPRTSTGKILKREIARRIETGEIGTQPSGADECDLNLDSLGRVQLQAQLEQQHGILIDDVALQNVKTQQDLQNLLRQPPPTPAASRPAPEHSYPHWPWHPVQQAIRTVFLETIAMPIAWFLVKPRVRLEIHEWPREPVLIVCNHITAYDAAFVLYALPRRIRRRVVILMSAEILLDIRLGRNQGSRFVDTVAPAGYWLATALFNVFPLPQLSGFRQSFRHAGEAVDRGYSVMSSRRGCVPMTGRRCLLK
ncbi:MAG: AMP-binding protein [Acidobacteriaceae bacterium]|nr:AMP-binding protein [Acidobacteriaceae bacterium]